ncbi:MAG: hypothetical protein HC854_01265 [Flavobacterium sp.]|nr:hypothetical protein [Flavobacterium sp.]
MKAIKYGSDTNEGINKVEFIYKDKIRQDSYYVWGSERKRNKVLSEIKVVGNGIPFRNYYLTHDLTSTGYERLKSFQEKTGDNTKNLNPITFNYNQNQTSINQQISYSSKGANFLYDSLNTNIIKGDFNGDGEIEFVTDFNTRMRIYKINSQNNQLTELYSDLNQSFRAFHNVSIKTLDNNKFFNKDYFLKGGGVEFINGESYEKLKVASFNSITNSIDILFEKK